jgi:hypothetical protein
VVYSVFSLQVITRQYATLSIDRKPALVMALPAVLPSWKFERKKAMIANTAKIANTRMNADESRS